MFTNLHYWKSDQSLGIDPDEQISFYIKHLNGQVKDNWKVIAPTPMTRVVYFEMEDGVSKPEIVEGSSFETRAQMIGEKPSTAKRGRGRPKKKNT